MSENKWKLIVSRRVSVFRSFVMAQGSLQEMERYLGVRNDFFVVTKDELSKVYYALKDLAAISQSVIDKIQEDKDYPNKYVQDCHDACDELVQVSKQSGDKERLVQADVEELGERFRQYLGTYRRFVKFVTIPIAIEQALTKKITDFLSQKLDNGKVGRYLAKLMTAPRLPQTNQEQIDLVKLAVDIKKSSQRNYSKLLKGHFEKYSWLSCYNIDEAPFEFDYFTKRIEELLSLEQPSLTEQLQMAEQQLSDDEQEYKRVIAELGIDGETLGQIELLREYVYLRTYRIEMQSKSNYYIQTLFSEIGEKFNRSLREMAALAPEEIETLLLGKNIPSHEVLERRAKSYVLLSHDNSIQLSLDEMAEEVAKQELGDKEVDEVDSVKGTIAYKGKAKGVVRVLLKKEQVAEFQSDEVLVTTMTSPEFIPAIRKAMAIVTNEGGVLCHAAIVAREFKIPCVIGTQRATEILQTGDEVEVNADNGVVRVLQRAKPKLLE